MPPKRKVNRRSAAKKTTVKPKPPKKAPKKKETDGENQCRLCLLPMENPYELACGHSFCTICLRTTVYERYFESRNKCPMCRAKFPLRPLRERKI